MLKKFGLYLHSESGLVLLLLIICSKYFQVVVLLEFTSDCSTFGNRDFYKGYLFLWVYGDTSRILHIIVYISFIDIYYLFDTGSKTSILISLKVPQIRKTSVVINVYEFGMKANKLNVFQSGKTINSIVNCWPQSKGFLSEVRISLQIWDLE